MSTTLSRYFELLQQRQPWRWRGNVVQSIGNTIESAGPVTGLGECCEEVDSQGITYAAEVIGFRGANVLSMPLEGRRHQVR